MYDIYITSQRYTNTLLWCMYVFLRGPCLFIISVDISVTRLPMSTITAVARQTTNVCAREFTRWGFSAGSAHASQSARENIVNNKCARAKTTKAQANSGRV